MTMSVTVVTDIPMMMKTSAFQQATVKGIVVTRGIVIVNTETRVGTMTETVDTAEQNTTMTAVVDTEQQTGIANVIPDAANPAGSF